MKVSSYTTVLPCCSPLYVAVKGLLKHFVSPVISDGGTRKKTRLPSQPPAPIVSLYNAVLQHLIKTAVSEEILTLNWPVVEFVSSEHFSHGGILLINGLSK